jgi:hypothetical protein
MCKTMATETNENRRDIIEIKSHLGLPTDPYCELPTFDDPLRCGTPKMKMKGKKRERRRTTMKKKRRTTRTPSDLTASPLLF